VQGTSSLVHGKAVVSAEQAERLLGAARALLTSNNGTDLLSLMTHVDSSSECGGAGHRLV
jgi:hypothetical protein